jgi:hypothetical protein
MTLDFGLFRIVQNLIISTKILSMQNNFEIHIIAVNL